MRGNVDELEDGFRPHVTLAYSGYDAPTTEIRSRLEHLRDRPPVATHVSQIQLIALNRDEKMYRWEVAATVPLTGHARGGVAATSVVDTDGDGTLPAHHLSVAVVAGQLVSADRGSVTPGVEAVWQRCALIWFLSFAASSNKCSHAELSVEGPACDTSAAVSSSYRRLVI